MLQCVLDAVLTNEQREAGLYLEEEGDHFLLLKQGQVVRAVFSQTGARVIELQNEANKWIERR